MRLSRLERGIASIESYDQVIGGAMDPGESTTFGLVSKVHCKAEAFTRSA
jgi:hypothetical protein